MSRNTRGRPVNSKLVWARPPHADCRLFNADEVTHTHADCRLFNADEVLARAHARTYARTHARTNTHTHTLSHTTYTRRRAGTVTAP